MSRKMEIKGLIKGLLYRYLPVLFSGLIVISAIWTYHTFAPANIELRTITEYQKVPEEKIITKIKKVEVPGPEKVITIEKEKVVKELKLPDWIKENNDLQVIANANIPPYSGETSAIALLNTKTGESQIDIKQKPLPFIQLLNEKEIGIRYGVSSKELRAGEIYGRWTIGRISSLKTGIYAEANTGGEGKIMLDIRTEF